MQKDIPLFKIGGLQLSVRPSAVAGWLVLWLALTLMGVAAIGLPGGQAILGGALATAIHLLSETAHQVGHALAARRTGFPMVGVRYWGVLSTSVYPAFEPELPAAIHIRRALGGPPMSLGLGLAAIAPTLLLSPADGVIFWLAAFAVVDNLLVLGLGALLPLGFTDGSTLLKHWRTRRRA